MAMIASIKLDDFVAPRKSARQTNGAHARFRAGIGHPDFLDRGHELANSLRHFHFIRVWNAKTGSFLRGGLYCRNDFGMGMAQDGRAPGTDIINQLITVHVPNTRAFGSVHEKRIAAHSAKGAHGRIHATGNKFQRFGKKLFGPGVHHRGNNLTAQNFIQRAFSRINLQHLIWWSYFLMTQHALFSIPAG